MPAEKEADDEVPDTIHAGYVKEFEQENLQNDHAKNLTPMKEHYDLKNEYSKQNNYYAPDSSSYSENSVSRFEKDSGHDMAYDKNYVGKVDKNSYDWTKDQNSYPMYQDSPAR